jgi:hypothetical protein
VYVAENATNKIKNNETNWEYGLILEGLAMEDVGIFNGHFVYFT